MNPPPFQKISFQNKFHYAITNETAAEIIYHRANSQKEHIGLTFWKRSSEGRILKSDVSIAKNYLTSKELEFLQDIVNMYLDIAENRAKRQIPMKMQDLVEELRNILGKDFKNLKMLFCTTASNYEGEDMNDWLIEDMIYFKNLGFKIDVCNINGISIENFLPRFKCSDIFYFEGGNTQWLRKCIRTSGLEEYLRKLLETRVWIRASAASCVLCPTVCNLCQDLFDENIEGYPIDGLDLVDFQFVPHFNNKWFSKKRKENILSASKNSKEIDGKKLYVTDDNRAIFVDGKNVKVISEGDWFEV